MASNGTVQAKTWNPNGLAAVANLPCGRWMLDAPRLTWRSGGRISVADATPITFEYPGAAYHIMSPGDLPSSDYGKARPA
jgi:hypothetical protein